MIQYIDRDRTVLLELLKVNTLWRPILSDPRRLPDTCDKYYTARGVVEPANLWAASRLLVCWLTLSIATWPCVPPRAVRRPRNLCCTSSSAITPRAADWCLGSPLPAVAPSTLPNAWSALLHAAPPQPKCWRPITATAVLLVAMPTAAAAAAAVALPCVRCAVRTRKMWCEKTKTTSTPLPRMRWSSSTEYPFRITKSRPDDPRPTLRTALPSPLEHLAASQRPEVKAWMPCLLTSSLLPSVSSSCL